MSGGKISFFPSVVGQKEGPGGVIAPIVTLLKDTPSTFQQIALLFGYSMGGAYGGWGVLTFFAALSF